MSKYQALREALYGQEVADDLRFLARKLAECEAIEFDATGDEPGMRHFASLALGHGMSLSFECIGWRSYRIKAIPLFRGSR